MKKEILANSFVLIGVIAYNFLFWGEKLGLNTLIFSTLLIGSLFTLYPESRQSKMAITTAIATVFTAAMIVYNNSMYAKVMHIISLVATVGFVQQHVLRFFWYGFMIMFLNLTQLPKRWKKELGKLTKNIKGFQKIKRFLKLAILPFVIVLVFYGIYAFANPNFARLSGDFFLLVNDFLFVWLDTISFDRVFFILSGFVIVSLVIYKNDWEWVQNLEINKRFKLTRQLSKIRRLLLAEAKREEINEHEVNFPQGFSRKKTPKFTAISLKNEYRTALILLWSLNALLLVVNLTDFRYVWADFSQRSATELKQFVHEGTYLLIFAILLAMAVILYYFRKKLNFYPRNTWLKNAAYVWIFQNVLLAFSVGVRNFHYIVYDGLAYKRLGVCVFLLLVAIGLFTMFLKVRDKRTGYYLFFTNSWSTYLVLVFFAFVNWDVWITEYNLKHFPNDDKLHFLIMEVSDKNLWVLKENGINNYTLENGTLSNRIKEKRIAFWEAQSVYSWASWNYADYINEQRLK